jgi:magnesium chelatase subunit I
MLIDNAIISEFESIFPRIPRLEKEGVKTTYTDIIEWFNSNLLELNYTDDDEEFLANLKSVKPLVSLVDEYCGEMSDSDKAFSMELVLWSLTVSDKLDKAENDDTFKFDSAGLDTPFFGNN